jgi:hypothetical protein
METLAFQKGFSQDKGCPQGCSSDIQSMTKKLIVTHERPLGSSAREPSRDNWPKTAVGRH